MTTPKINIENYLNDKINEKQIIDFVEHKLIKQGCLSLDSGGCAYRGANDTKCAIGFLISDAEYAKLVKLGLGSTGSNKLMETLYNVPESSPKAEFLACMQYMHDGYPNHSENDFVSYIHQKCNQLRGCSTWRINDVF